MRRNAASVAPTIYARIDPDDKDWLKKRVAEEGNWSENAVVSQLLKHFRFLSEEEQRDIVNGAEGGALTRAGALMNRISWLQHAFGQKFWAWALEESYELAKEAQAAHAYEIWKFSQYRAAYCWLDIALDLRSEAIRLGGENWDKFYESVDWSLCASIVHNRCHSAGRPGGREILNTPSRHPLVAYNLACSLTLRAQYAIERYLGPDAEFIKQLAERMKQMEDPKKEMGEFNTNWREDLKQSNRLRSGFESFESAVIQAAKEAMEQLRLLKTRSSFTEIPRDTGFMIRYSPFDKDLELLRSDKAFENEFRDWREQDSSEHMLRTFTNAKENTPLEVRKLVEFWSAENPIVGAAIREWPRSRV